MSLPGLPASLFLLVLIAAAAPSGCAGAQDVPRVLVFSKTAGFRHDSIPDAVASVRRIGTEKGFEVDATEDSGTFTDSNLRLYRAIVFLLTTGDVLGLGEQAAFERYVRSGGGFAGVHSASDTEYGWAWYGGLVGAYFASHPAVQTARVGLEDRLHPSTAALPDPWVRSDEWYDFRSNPRGRVHVLASLDETTYAGGTMGDHPIAWCHRYDGGRAWYTAGGHTARELRGALLPRASAWGGRLGGRPRGRSLRPGPPAHRAPRPHARSAARRQEAAPVRP